MDTTEKNSNIEFPVLKNDLLLRAARREKTDRAPVWIMRQAGRYLPEFRAMRAENEFFKVCQTPKLATEITLQPIRRYEGLLDAAIIFSDILVIPQALGLVVQMIPGKGPSFPVTIDTPDEIKTKLLSAPDIEKSLAYVGEAITMTRHALEGKVPLIGFAGAPWTLMAYMIEGGGSKTWLKSQSWLYRWPEASHSLLQIITDAVVRFLVLQVRAGAQILQVFDSWAGELSVDTFRSFSLPYLEQIARRVKAEVPGIPIIVFAKGANHSIRQMSQLSLSSNAPLFDVLALDWGISPSDAREQVQDRVSLMGNLNPAILYADEKVIRAEVKKMIESFGGARNYIANLGHGLSPDMDPEHVRWFLQAIHDFSSSASSTSTPSS